MGSLLPEGSADNAPASAVSIVSRAEPAEATRRLSAHLSVPLVDSVRPSAFHIKEGLKDLHSQLTGAPRVDKLQATFQMLASARASQRLDLQALAQLNAAAIVIQRALRQYLARLRNRKAAAMAAKRKAQEDIMAEAAATVEEAAVEGLQEERISTTGAGEYDALAEEPPAPTTPPAPSESAAGSHGDFAWTPHDSTLQRGAQSVTHEGPPADSLPLDPTSTTFMYESESEYGESHRGYSISGSTRGAGVQYSINGSTSKPTQVPRLPLPSYPPPQGAPLVPLYSPRGTTGTTPRAPLVSQRSNTVRQQAVPEAPPSPRVVTLNLGAALEAARDALHPQPLKSSRSVAGDRDRGSAPNSPFFGVVGSHSGQPQSHPRPPHPGRQPSHHSSTHAGYGSSNGADHGSLCRSNSQHARQHRSAAHAGPTSVDDVHDWMLVQTLLPVATAEARGSHGSRGSSSSQAHLPISLMGSVSGHTTARSQKRRSSHSSSHPHSPVHHASGHSSPFTMQHHHAAPPSHTPSWPNSPISLLPTAGKAASSKSPHPTAVTVAPAMDPLQHTKELSALELGPSLSVSPLRPTTARAESPSHAHTGTTARGATSASTPHPTVVPHMAGVLTQDPEPVQHPPTSSAALQNRLSHIQGVRRSASPTLGRSDRTSSGHSSTDPLSHSAATGLGTPPRTPTRRSTAAQGSPAAVHQDSAVQPSNVSPARAGTPPPSTNNSSQQQHRLGTLSVSLSSNTQREAGRDLPTSPSSSLGSPHASMLVTPGGLMGFLTPSPPSTPSRHSTTSTTMASRMGLAGGSQGIGLSNSANALMGLTLAAAASSSSPSHLGRSARLSSLTFTTQPVAATRPLTAAAAGASAGGSSSNSTDRLALLRGGPNSCTPGVGGSSSTSLYSSTGAQGYGPTKPLARTTSAAADLTSALSGSGVAGPGSNLNAAPGASASTEGGNLLPNARPASPSVREGSTYGGGGGALHSGEQYSGVSSDVNSSAEMLAPLVRPLTPSSRLTSATLPSALSPLATAVSLPVGGTTPHAVSPLRSSRAVATASLQTRLSSSPGFLSHEVTQDHTRLSHLSHPQSHLLSLSGRPESPSPMSPSHPRRTAVATSSSTTTAAVRVTDSGQGLRPWSGVPLVSGNTGQSQSVLHDRFEIELALSPSAKQPTGASGLLGRSDGTSLPGSVSPAGSSPKHSSELSLFPGATVFGSPAAAIPLRPQTSQAGVRGASLSGVAAAAGQMLPSGGSMSSSLSGVPGGVVAPQLLPLQHRLSGSGVSRVRRQASGALIPSSSLRTSMSGLSPLSSSSHFTPPERVTGSGVTQPSTLGRRNSALQGAASGQQPQQQFAGAPVVTQSGTGVTQQGGVMKPMASIDVDTLLALRAVTASPV